MTDQKPKTKADWTSWKNKPYATGDDKKKQQAEAFELLNSFVRHHGGSITSPPGRFVRIECPRGYQTKFLSNSAFFSALRYPHCYPEAGGGFGEGS
jgi:hypothetical protein